MSALLSQAADLRAEIASLREENARLREDCAATLAAWAEAYDAAGRMFCWMSEHAGGWAKSLLLRHAWLPEAARACRTALDAPPAPDDYLASLEHLAIVAGQLRHVLGNTELRERFVTGASPSLVRGLGDLHSALRSWLAEAAIGRVHCKTSRQSLAYWGDEEE